MVQEQETVFGWDWIPCPPHDCQCSPRGHCRTRWSTCWCQNKSSVGRVSFLACFNPKMALYSYEVVLDCSLSYQFFKCTDGLYLLVRIVQQQCVLMYGYFEGATIDWSWEHFRSTATRRLGCMPFRSTTCWWNLALSIRVGIIGESLVLRNGVYHFLFVASSTHCAFSVLLSQQQGKTGYGWEKGGAGGRWTSEG